MIPSYPDLYAEVAYGGRKTESRHGPARELFAKQVEFPAGELVARKGLSHGLGFMELMQILGGVFDKDRILEMAPQANPDLFTPQMAYGLRMGRQVPQIV